MNGLKTYVADIDDLTTERIGKELPGQTFGGWGETFWIRDGKVLQQLRGYDITQAKQIEDFTRELLTDQDKSNL